MKDVDGLSSQPGASSGASQPSGTTAATRFPEIFFSVMVLLLVAVWIIQNYAVFRRHPGSDWNSSEWMIDYAAGFLRRGLGGAVLAAIVRVTGLGFFPVWMALTTAAYLGLCSVLVALSRRMGGPALWRLALLLNPALLLAACEYGSFARKDILFFWGTLLNVALVGRALRRSASSSAPRGGALLPLASFLVSSLILVLLHEGVFLFAWLPLNFALLAWGLARLRFSPPGIAVRLALAFAPALVALAACIHAHGDPRSAEVICNSWRFAMPVDCSPGPFFPPSISAFSWTLRADIVGSLGYIAGLPAYLAIFALTAAIQIITVQALVPAARLEHLLALALVPFAASLPLYVLGADWGRWLSLVATSSLFAMLSDPVRPCLYGCLPAALRSVIANRLSPPLARFLPSLRGLFDRHAFLFFAAMVIFPVPPFPIRGSLVIASPIAIVLNFVSRFLMH